MQIKKIKRFASKKATAAILALAVGTTYMPMTAASANAEGNDAATYNGTSYDTVQAAVDAAASEGRAEETVTVNKDVSEDIVIPAGLNVVLDTNGKTITNDDGDTITVENGAEVLVNGSGTLNNKTTGSSTVYNNGRVEMNDVNVTKDVTGGSDTPVVVLNHGGMETDRINVTAKDDKTILFESGYSDYGSKTERSGYVAGINSMDPYLYINGGKFSGGKNAVANEDSGDLTINDGEFGETSAENISNQNMTTVNGGTFAGSKTAPNAVFANSTNGSTHTAGFLQILNGTFNGKALVNNDSANNLGQVEINGGDFSAIDTLATGNIEDAEIAVTGGLYKNGVPNNYVYGNVSYEFPAEGMIRIISMVDQALSLIDNLPSDVTVNDKDAIEKARAVYDTLDDYEKDNLGDEVALKLSLAEAKLATAQANQEKEAIQRDLENAEKAKAKAERDLENAKRELAEAQGGSEATERIKALEEQLTNANKEIDSLKEKQSSLESDKSTLEATNKTLKEELEKAQSEKPSEDATKTIESLQNQIKEVNEKLAAERKARKTAEEQLETSKIKAQAVSGIKVKSGKRKATVTYKTLGKGYSYKIYRAAKKTGKYKVVKTTASNKFTDSKLKKGKKYFYKVRALKKVGSKNVYTKYSKTIGAKIK